jgi:hypothetical protein
MLPEAVAYAAIAGLALERAILAAIPGGLGGAAALRLSRLPHRPLQSSQRE